MNRSLSQTLITGVYRTGSEYAAQLANCHPHLSVTMYSINALRFVYGRFDSLETRANTQAAVAAVAERLRVRYQRELAVDRVLERLEHEPRVNYGLLYDAIMCELYLRPPAEHWAEKNQLLWREIPTFLDSMPNGRAVLVLRDPRSVLTSFKKFTYAPAPAYLGAVFNCLDAMLHAQRHARSLPADRFLVIRYEDAAREPQSTAERIWSFLGLQGSHDVSDRRNWKDAYGESWHANSSFQANDDARPFNVGRSIERWRGEIEPGELALAEVVCADVMPEYGYTPSSAAPDWSAALRLCADNDQIMGYLRHWLRTGEGIEAFPTDPLDSANWRDA